ncbi:SCP2 sterol-binding domain-containing protein [Peribacillus sp. SCS-37]|uniref:SCP2 sterol-binding domain-containing protein n=1 Tax=Paraperibacillus esterisolvens TaxID=3115296 RepID=UPI003905D0B6
MVERLCRMFLANLKRKTYLIPILSGDKRIVCLQTAQEEKRLVLSRKKQDFSAEGDRAHFYIEGREESLAALIMGREKLQTLVKENHLKVTGSFRDLLYLESVFLLNKPRP